MNTARVKTLKPKGCTQSFGSFELIYPQNLYGVIEPLEFETTIKTINEKCHTVLSKKYLLLFLPTLVGIILTICGFVKFAKDGNDAMNNNHVSMISSSGGGVQTSLSSSSGSSSSSISSSGLSSSISSSGSISSSSSSISSSSSSISSSSSFTSNPFSSGISTNNWMSSSTFKDLAVENLNDFNMSVSGPSPVDYSTAIALIVIGMILTIVGCCSYGIAYFIFTRKVIKKIEAELEIVNAHFSSRRISWSLESEMQVKYIPDFEYNTHKGNRAYMQDVKFDRDNRPYKEVLVYFIEIQFPATQNSTYNSSSSNHSHISLGINGAGNQVSFGVSSSSSGGYGSISMNNL